MSWNVALPADSSKIKLSAGYIRTNESAIQVSLSTSSLTGGYVFIPTTAPIWFYADAAPSGWTLVVAPPTDCLIALKGGASQYGAPAIGGTQVGTWAGPNHILTIPEIPAHTHNYLLSTNSYGVGTGTHIAYGQPYNLPTATSSTGGAGAHHHDWSATRPSAALGVLCTKNA